MMMVMSCENGRHRDMVGNGDSQKTVSNNGIECCSGCIAANISPPPT